MVDSPWVRRPTKPLTNFVSPPKKLNRAHRCSPEQQQVRLDRFGEDRATTSGEVATSRVKPDPPGPWLIRQYVPGRWPIECGEEPQLPHVESHAEFGYVSPDVGLRGRWFAASWVTW